MKGFTTTVILALVGIIITVTILVKQHAPRPKNTMMVADPPSSIYSQAIAGSGIIEALEENIQVGIHIPGVVKELFVQVGDRVAEGEPLLLIDDDLLRKEIEADKLAITSKALEVKKIKEQLERLHNVEDPRAISKEDLDNKTLDFYISKVDLAEKKRRLEEKEEELKKHLVIAPKGGIISRLAPRIGEYLSNQAKEPPILIGSSKLQIRADIDEENAGRVKKESPAIAYTRGLNKIPLELECIRIEPYVIPKTSLTGASNERVDTRVLQVIYSIKNSENLPIYIGQQIDIYIKDTNG